MSNKTGILFVCTGNICRSPTAEGVFRHRVLAAGLEDNFLIDSAGIEGYHAGNPPDSRSIRTALGRGVRIDDLRARRVERSDFRDFDLLLAMDRGHFRALHSLRPAGSRAEIAMFLDFEPSRGQGDAQDVPDPYYGGAEDFIHVFNLVEKGVEGLLQYLLAGRLPEKSGGEHAG